MDWEQPPNGVYPSLNASSARPEQLRVKPEQEDQGWRGASADISESEDGILLIPEGRGWCLCAGAGLVLPPTHRYCSWI